MAADESLQELFSCMRQPLGSVTLRRFFLMLMRAHWSDPDNHGTLSDLLGCMVYSDPPEKSKLPIFLSHDYDPSQGSRIPSIYVAINQFRLAKVALGNEAGYNEDNSARTELKRCDAEVRVAHRAMSADQALLMAESGAALLQGVHKDIAGNLDLLDFQVNGWTDALRREQGETRYFQVDLTCSVAFNFLVQIETESHRIKKFGLKVNASI